MEITPPVAATGTGYLAQMQTTASNTYNTASTFLGEQAGKVNTAMGPAFGYVSKGAKAAVDYGIRCEQGLLGFASLNVGVNYTVDALQDIQKASVKDVAKGVAKLAMAATWGGTAAVLFNYAYNGNPIVNSYLYE